MIEILLWNTLVAAALAVIVLAVCHVARPSSATRHALWLVVVIKLLSPVGLLWEAPLPFERPSLLDGLAPGRPSVALETSRAQASALPTDQPMVLMFHPGVELEPTYEDILIAPREIADEGIGASAATPIEWIAQQSPDSPGSPTPAPGSGLSLYQWLLIVWLAGALAVGWRYVWRTWRFALYAGSGKPASPSLQREVAELSTALGVRPPRVRLLADLPSPVVWCLGRRVLLWPKGLQDQLSGPGRRAVLVHELAHLRRRDHWVRWLELLAAVIHWWNPLFWLARRQLRFHAELACDAWVTGTLPDARRSYAEALLEVCMRTSKAAAPSPAVGAGGDGRGDFQRRLTMIMRDQAPCRLAAGAKLFVVLLALAALPAWTLGQAEKSKTEPAKPADEAAQLKIVLDKLILEVDAQGDFWKKQGDVKQAVGADKQIQEIEAKIAELRAQLDALKQRKAATDALKKVEPLQFRLEGKTVDGQLRFQTIDSNTKKPEAKTAPVNPPASIELKVAPGAAVPGGWEIQRSAPLPGQSQSQTPSANGGFAKQPTYKVIGPDGLEIKGAKVIFGGDTKVVPQAQRYTPAANEQQLQRVGEGLKALGTTIEMKTATLSRSQPAASGSAVSLSRATYNLPKARAEALAAFLQANVKASVLEFKVENNGLTVTTTPDVQTTIGGIVKLMGTGDGSLKIEGLRFELVPDKKP